MKKPYITLIDRTWKGKEWFSSFRGHKYIRLLTKSEAKSLTNIEEVVPIKPCEKDVVGVEGGKMFCLKCGNKNGFYIHKMRKGKQLGWYNILKCSVCGAREMKYLYNKENK